MFQLENENIYLKTNKFFFLAWSGFLDARLIGVNIYMGMAHTKPLMSGLKLHTLAGIGFVLWEET